MLALDTLLQLLPLEIWDRIICYLELYEILSLSQTEKEFELYLAKQEALLSRAFLQLLPTSSISKVKRVIHEEYCYAFELDKTSEVLKLRFPNIPSVVADSSKLYQLQLLLRFDELQFQSTEAFQRACMFQANRKVINPEDKQVQPTSIPLQELAVLQQSWIEPYYLPTDYALLLAKYSQKFWYNTYFGYMDNLWHGLHWGSVRSGALRVLHLNPEGTSTSTTFLEIAGRFQVPTLSVLLNVTSESTTFGQVFIKEGIQEPKWVDWSVTDFLVRISDYAREDWIEADLFTVIDHLFLDQSNILESRIPVHITST
ncbi:hypothetical protein K7432_012348 [Basidiobolus ranarum]|uniref:F-box domain-containing protein n=1 Tax=Basidiobolus ranarum TaxID=34480 RepID=A0ABR2VSY8_9FUNG